MERPDPHRALLEAIRAAPEALEPRRIYADALQEAGDPYGEFIALQLEDTLASTARAQRLFESHRDAFLGPLLSQVLADVEMRRGFLHGATLRSSAASERWIWDEATRDPRLVTLRWLERGRANLADAEAFLTSPALPRLTDVEANHPALVQALLDCHHPRTITRLWLRELPRPHVLRDIAAHDAFTTLREVALEIGSAPHGAQLLASALPVLRANGLAGVDAVWLRSSAGVVGYTIFERFDAYGLRALTVGSRYDAVRLEEMGSGLGLTVRGRLGDHLEALIDRWVDRLVSVSLTELLPGDRAAELAGALVRSHPQLDGAIHVRA